MQWRSLPISMINCFQKCNWNYIEESKYTVVWTKKVWYALNTQFIYNKIVNVQMENYCWISEGHQCPRNFQEDGKIFWKSKNAVIIYFHIRLKKVKSCLHELMVLKGLKQIFCLMLCVECDDKMLKFPNRKKSFYIHFCKSEKLKWKPSLIWNFKKLSKTRNQQNQ